MHDFEKLGAFYLGTPVDPATRERRDGVVLYDSRDLVTHALCVGMTGSGKTGLCIGLLEEAAIDGIPAIVIDPKGDLANLLLAFPDLAAADFEPWVHPDDVRASGLSTAAFAASEAERWRAGLASSGQDAARVRRLAESAEFAVYTPGSQAGIPVSILKSFAAPDAALLADEELLNERIATSAQSLLGLLSIDADPLQSREFILLSAILSEAWRAGRDVDLAALIQSIRMPPFDRVGAFDTESFFSAKERFAFALKLNNLLASPTFAEWLTGEPLDVERALHAPSGKPRISIFSIAHLSDAERMFFVSLLLNQVLAWTRRQSGTQSLRAIVYMDEIFGYFPPVAEPPSKRPLLSLLKTARAFGVGVVLATQNPVDLDYKGLANAGTWFIGRLQTERDKARVLDGLEAASAGGRGGFDRATMDRLISSLEKRVFLLHDVHEDGPALFQTRWTLTYLRGPMARAELLRLKALRTPLPVSAEVSARTASATSVAARSGSSDRPVLPPDIPQVFLPARSVGPVTYSPVLLGCARVTFQDTRAGVACERIALHRAEFHALLASVDWNPTAELDLRESDLAAAPSAGASFVPPPSIASQSKSYAAWRKSYADFLVRGQTLELWRSPTFKLVSEPTETEGGFRMRLQHAAREERDRQAERLRQKYAPKLATLTDRVRRAEQAIEREKEQASQSKMQTALSFGATLLSAFTGRKTLSAATLGRATTAARGVGRSIQQGRDVGRAEENSHALAAELASLEREFRDETAALEAKLDPAREVLERVVIPAKRNSIEVRLVALAWCPTARD